MTKAEMEGRLIVQEALLMAPFGALYARAHAPDPGNKQAIASLKALKEGVLLRLREQANADVLRAGTHHLDLLLSEISDGIQRAG